VNIQQPSAPGEQRILLGGRLLGDGSSPTVAREDLSQRVTLYDEEISQTEQTFGGTEVIIWRSAARRWIVAGSHHQVANDSSVQG